MNEDFIIRWTFGEAIGRTTSLQALDMLECSIKYASIHFPNAEKYLCYNSISSPRLLRQLDSLRAFDVTFIDQSEFSPIFQNVNGKNSFWKYLPTRINKEKYELFLDNDVVIWRLNSAIPEWLKSQGALISEDWNGQFYGELSKEIPVGRNLNTGVLGLPPGIEIHLPDIRQFQEFFHTEQGFVVHEILNSEIPLMIIDKECIFQANHFLDRRPTLKEVIEKFDIGHFCGCSYSHYFEWDKYYKDGIWRYLHSEFGKF